MYVVMFMMAEGNHLAAEATRLQFSRHIHPIGPTLPFSYYGQMHLSSSVWTTLLQCDSDNHEDRPGRNKYTISLISPCEIVRHEVLSAPQHDTWRRQHYVNEVWASPFIRSDPFGSATNSVGRRPFTGISTVPLDRVGAVATTTDFVCLLSP